MLSSYLLQVQRQASSRTTADAANAAGGSGSGRNGDELTGLGPSVLPEVHPTAVAVSNAPVPCTAAVDNESLGHQQPTPAPYHHSALITLGPQVREHGGTPVTLLLAVTRYNAN